MHITLVMADSPNVRYWPVVFASVQVQVIVEPELILTGGANSCCMGSSHVVVS